MPLLHKPTGQVYQSKLELREALKIGDTTYRAKARNGEIIQIEDTNTITSNPTVYEELQHNQHGRN